MTTLLTGCQDSRTLPPTWTFAPCPAQWEQGLKTVESVEETKTFMPFWWGTYFGLESAKSLVLSVEICRPHASKTECQLLNLGGVIPSKDTGKW